MSRDTEPVEIPYDRIVHETVSAILFEIDKREVWIPRSQMLEHDQEEHEFSLPEWLAVEKELV